MHTPREFPKAMHYHRLCIMREGLRWGLATWERPKAIHYHRLCITRGMHYERFACTRFLAFPLLSSQVSLASDVERCMSDVPPGRTASRVSGHTEAAVGAVLCGVPCPCRARDFICGPRRVEWWVVLPPFLCLLSLSRAVHHFPVRHTLRHCL